MRLISFYDASVGFSDATEGRIATPSSEGATGKRTAVSERGYNCKPGYSRSAAKTDSGSEPEALPTAIQPNRLTSAPIRNEIAANGT